MDASNPFDQFDGTPTAFGSAPSAAPVASPSAPVASTGNNNPFDQFDGSPTAFGSSPPSQSSASTSPSSGTTTPTSTDRAPTIGQVGQQFGYGLLQGIPSAIEGTANMLEKGTMQGFTNPDTGESLFSQLGRDIGISSAAPPAPKPYEPKTGGLINSGLSAVGLNPNNLPQAQSGPERIANLAGQGAVLAVAPELGGLGDAGLMSKIGSLIRPAAVGTVSGAAGQTAAEVVPDQYKPLATAAGAILGGAGAEGLASLGKGAIDVAGNVVAPLTRSGQEASAGSILASKAGTTPADLINTIDNTQGEIVPGSQPTLFQQTGNMGLGGFERSVAAQNPEIFNAARAQQNSARLDALGSIQADGAPEAVSSTVQAQLDDLNQQTQNAIDMASGNVSSAVDALGSEAPAAANGDMARSAVQAQLDASRKQSTALKNAIDPTGNAQVTSTPFKQAMSQVYGNLTAAASAGIEPSETTLMNLADAYGPTMPIRELVDLNGLVAKGMREAQLSGSPAYGRLVQLKGSLEDVMDNTIQGQVQAERQAVASGDMAPEDTIFANMQRQAQEWQAGRGQNAVGADSDASFGTIRGERPASAPSVSGTASEIGSGPPSDAGTSGISEETGSGPIADQGTIDRFRAWRANAKQNQEVFGNPTIKTMVRRPGSTYPYNMPSERVAENLWKPGPAGGATIKAVARASNASPEAVEAIRNTAAASLRSKGALTPETLAKWQMQHADALNELENIAPGSKARFGDVQRATEHLGEVARQRKEALDAVQNSALGKVLKVNDPSDVTKTIGSIFGRNDSAKTMKELADATRSNPEAFQGLRKAIVDHMMSKVVSNAEAGTSGRDLIKADAFMKFLGNNTPALRQVFNDEEINSMRAVAQDLKRANRSITAVKLPGGSNTTQDLAAVGKHSLGPTLLNKLMTLASEGGASAVGSLFGPLGAVGGYVGAHVLGSMRTAGITKINDLVRDAMLDPQLAKTLLMKAPKRLNGGSERSLVERLARVGGLSGAITMSGNR